MKKIITILSLLLVFTLSANAAQCKAKTRAGKQCSRTAVIDGYCKQHFKILKNGKTTNGVQCKAETQAGNRCSRKAVKDGYCSQHFKHMKKVKNNPKYDEAAKDCFDEQGKPKKAANEAERCNASTKKGTRCKLKVVAGTRYCPSHTK